MDNPVNVSVPLDAVPEVVPSSVAVGSPPVRPSVIWPLNEETALPTESAACTVALNAVPAVLLVGALVKVSADSGPAVTLNALEKLMVIPPPDCDAAKVYPENAFFRVRPGKV